MPNSWQPRSVAPMVSSLVRSMIFAADYSIENAFAQRQFISCVLKMSIVLLLLLVRTNIVYCGSILRCCYCCWEAFRWLFFRLTHSPSLPRSITQWFLLFMHFTVHAIVRYLMQMKYKH